MKDGRFSDDGPKKAMLTDEHIRGLFNTPVLVREQAGWYYATGYSEKTCCILVTGTKSIVRTCLMREKESAKHTNSKKIVQSGRENHTASIA
jgi:hypothetical protein